MIDNITIDYGIRLATGDTGLSSQHPALKAQMELCDCLEDLDKLIVADLGGGSIVLKFQTPTGIIGDVKLLISSDKPISQKSIDCVQRFLATSRRIILTDLDSIRSKIKFNDLHKKLIKLEKDFNDEEFKELNPTLSLNKKLLAEIIVKLSKITIGRPNHQNITYHDRDGLIVFICEKPVDMDTLLDPLKKDDTPRDATFTIRRAPGTSDAKFDLLLDGRRVNHRIDHDEFLSEWNNGLHIFRCHSTMFASYKIERTHDKITIVIIEVKDILPPAGLGFQMSLDGIK
jgi:hypothetical protein